MGMNKTNELLTLICLVICGAIFNRVTKVIGGVNDVCFSSSVIGRKQLALGKSDPKYKVLGT